MSQFDDYFTRYGLPALQQQHGAPVVYTAAGQSPKPITAIVGQIDANEHRDSDGRLLSRSRIVEVALADVPNPSTFDTVIIDGLAWNVKSILGMKAGKADLELVRPEPMERSQGSYRNRR